MFIDEKTGTKIHADLETSVSRATLRPCDLVPRFLSVIRDTAEYAQLMSANLSWDESVITDQSASDTDERWRSESISYLLEELIDLLDTYAPDGYHFGTLEGDGSDFGFWRLY